MGEQWGEDPGQLRCPFCRRCRDFPPIEAELVAQARSQNHRERTIADENFVIKLYAHIRRLSK